MYIYLPVRIRQDGTIEQTSQSNAVGAYTALSTVPTAVYANLPDSRESRIEAAVVYTLSALGFIALLIFAPQASIFGALIYIAIYLALVAGVFYTVVLDTRPDIAELPKYIKKIDPSIEVCPSLEYFTSHYPRRTHK